MKIKTIIVGLIILGIFLFSNGLPPGIKIILGLGLVVWGLIGMFTHTDRKRIVIDRKGIHLKSKGIFTENDDTTTIE